MSTSHATTGSPGASTKQEILEFQSINHPTSYFRIAKVLLDRIKFAIYMVALEWLFKECCLHSLLGTDRNEVVIQPICMLASSLEHYVMAKAQILDFLFKWIEGDENLHWEGCCALQAWKTLPWLIRPLGLLWFTYSTSTQWPSSSPQPKVTLKGLEHHRQLSMDLLMEKFPRAVCTNIELKVPLLLEHSVKP